MRTQGPVSDQALGHLYRGELARADGWRTRLDTTVNWSISVSAAVITFSFSTPGALALPILAGMWLVTIFLVVEARRYRYYDVWYRRLRLIEDGIWAPMLRREPVDVDALRELAVNMERPQLQVTFLAAILVRIRRVYGSLLLLLAVMWAFKIDLHPTPASSFAVFFDRARLGPIPGWAVTLWVGLIAGVVLALTLLSFWTVAPQGELRTRRKQVSLRFWETVSRPYDRQRQRHLQREYTSRQSDRHDDSQTH
ncbi:MAG TPA: DUF2270 domain-containing protein [Myxococcaceae bacterium]|nr:DUF2270 domain-containing protein [Myxococcaceae bacterium]